jgi:SAM-dependent methyltransferase
MNGVVPEVPPDVAAFVRANLPPAPARVLEVGAGSGALAGLVARWGYDVVAIDPEPGGPGVAQRALADLSDADGTFDVAVAISSLHHVDPLGPSIARLAAALRPGGVLIVDEFDVAAFDVTAAGWWREQRLAVGAVVEATAEELVGDHRSHLHSLETMVAELRRFFALGRPVRGPWLYRWDLPLALREREEDLVARGELPAVGARFVGVAS